MVVVDPRQIVAGILTLSMFLMLFNMIKRDHFDSIEIELPGTTDVSFDDANGIEHGLGGLSGGHTGPWKDNEEKLQPCWTKPILDSEQSRGFVIFSLTNGPEHHVSQIADAVVVARYLGATLVIPDIRGSKPGHMRKFEDIYDREKFVESLDGVVPVAKHQPAEIPLKNLAVVRVPNGVTKEHIAEQIEPVFISAGSIRLATYFPSVNIGMAGEKSNVDSLACLGMFGTLELQPEMREVVDSMVESLHVLSRKSHGKFIAVDLRVDMLEGSGCHGNDATEMKSCYNAQEIALFLKKIGFPRDTTIYLTQSTWDSSLDALKNYFPKTYTKGGIMPTHSKEKFLKSMAPEFEEAIDFYICSRSNVFVPAISGMFYANVAGKRIVSGKTQILVPANIPGRSASAHDFVSHYVSKKNHIAYSCYC